MEYKVAVDSGVCVLAKRAGIVERVVGNEIRVRAEDGSVEYIKAAQPDAAY